MIIPAVTSVVDWPAGAVCNIDAIISSKLVRHHMPQGPCLTHYSFDTAAVEKLKQYSTAGKPLSGHHAHRMRALLVNLGGGVRIVVRHGMVKEGCLVHPTADTPHGERDHRASRQRGACHNRDLNTT